MSAPASPPPRLLLHEDEHLLVVCKPAGWNTHAPAPFAGEGLYDWLRHRKPRWASLSILHRLDKDTSGVLVFGKTTLANRSLTEQFTARLVRKKYLLVTDRPVERKTFTVTSDIARAGERYISRPGGEAAETVFRVINTSGRFTEVEAEPHTGRTHQIRVHASENGFPVLGDTLYGGSAAARLHLHSCELSFAHPETGEAVTFRAAPEFQIDPRVALRAALIDPAATNAFRLLHGAADARPGCYVDCLGPAVLWQGENAPDENVAREVLKLAEEARTGGAFRLLPLPARNERGEGRGEGLSLNERPSSPLPSPPSGAGEGVRAPAPQPSLYFKALNRHVRAARSEETSPRLLSGPPVPERFEILENGVRFELSFSEGYSVGLFLDQRDNRRRFLVNHVAAEFTLFEDGAAGREVLNTFAYTCGFSVCAAKAGARVTSLDLSKKYLEWGKRNFALNGIDPAAHDFIFGDAFDWMRRLAKKGRAFDAIILDPPTFSQSKESGVFRAEKDYGKLVTTALPLLKPGGVLLASTNAADLLPERFIECIEVAIKSAGRRVTQRHYVPQPPDFPVTRDEPAYLKTAWLRVK